MERTYIGVVQRFNERGFGFISCDEINYKVFFHVKDFMRGKDPVIGEKVTFHLGPSAVPGKPEAAKQVIPESPTAPMSGLNALAGGVR